MQISSIVLDARKPEEKPKFKCDYSYFEEADGFLKFHEIPSTWDDARLKCTIEGKLINIYLQIWP